MKKLIILPIFILFILLISSIGNSAYGDISGKVSEFSWSFPARVDYAVKPDSIRLGSSQYYLMVSGFGVPTYCVAKVLKVWDNNGTIQKSVVSSYTLYSSTTDYTKVLHVSGNVYAVAFLSPIVNRVVSFYVWENNGTIRGLNASKDLNNNGDYVDFTRMNNTNIFIVTYSKVGILGRRSLQYDKITINNDGSFGATVTNKVINALQGMYPRVICLNGTNDKILVSYYRNSTTDYKVMLETWNITSNTLIDRYIAVSYGFYPVCKYINNTIYVLAYQDISGNGQIYSFELYKTGIFPYKGFIEGGQFTTGKGGRFNTIFQSSITDYTGTKYNIYCITYQDNSSKGNITTLGISDTGGFSLKLSTFKYNNTASSYLCPVQYVHGNFYLLTYESITHGISCTINISTDIRKWNMLENSYNGQFTNTKFKLIDNSFNGQFRNNKYKILDNSFNGQFSNNKYKILDNSFNGQFSNNRFKLIDNSFNGSFKNIVVYHLVDTSFNGTFRNISINVSVGYLTISNEQPLNNSIINYYFDNDTFYLSFDVNKTLITWYNISVYFDGILVHVSNNSLNKSFLVNIYNNYSHELYYENTYLWNISINDSGGNNTFKSFNFNTGNTIFASSLSIEPFLMLLMYLFALMYFIFNSKTNTLFIGSKAHYIFILCTLVLLLGIEIEAFIGFGITDPFQRTLILPFILVFSSLLWMTRKK